MPKVDGAGQGSIFSRNDLEKFFKVVKKDSEYWYCFYKFLYYSGERSGCVIQVKWSDINFEKNLVTFRPETRKGDIARKPLFMHPELKKVLLDAQKLIRHLYGFRTASKIEFIFCGLRDEQKHVSRSYMNAVFKRLLLEAGFENKGFSLHSFRRTFVTRLYEKNKNIKECMAITGHKDIKHFMTYIDVNQDNVEETILSL